MNRDILDKVTAKLFFLTKEITYLIGWVNKILKLFASAMIQSMILLKEFLLLWRMFDS